MTKRTDKEQVENAARELGTNDVEQIASYLGWHVTEVETALRKGKAILG